MSYCRWSLTSDVYCYREDGGFTIHVTDGRSFYGMTLQECRDQMAALSIEGLKVPHWAIEMLNDLT